MSQQVTDADRGVPAADDKSVSGLRRSASPARLASLDQFRGFAVLGMYVVNFLGHFQVTPEFLRHHAAYAMDDDVVTTYVTYADMVMPQFFLAAGFACRLTVVRRLKRDGPRSAYGHLLQRCLGLLVIGLFVYGLDSAPRSWAELQALGIRGFFATAFQRNYFQTLVHLGVTTLWVMPVIAGAAWERTAFAVFSGVLHLALSGFGYYTWVMARPGIDGGPLGFLTWTIPFMVGTLAYDLTTARAPAVRAVWFAVLGLVLMGCGYGLSCVRQPSSTAADFGWRLAAPPLMPPTDSADIFTMSQRAGSVSYLAFAAGFSLATLAAFVLACDVGRLQSRLLQTLGENALVAYLLHYIVGRPLKLFSPKDAPAWFAIVVFVVFVWICVMGVRWLERKGVRLRL
jgi:predicted acyltransferase